jgi:hypothetical protein
MPESANRTYYRNARYFWRTISIVALVLSFVSFVSLRFLGSDPFFHLMGWGSFYVACYLVFAGFASLCLFRIRIAEIDGLKRSLTLFFGIIGFRKHLTLDLDRIESITVTRRAMHYRIYLRGLYWGPYWGPASYSQRVLLFRLKSNLPPGELRKVVQMDRYSSRWIGFSADGTEAWLPGFPKAKFGLLLSDLADYGVAVDKTSMPAPKSLIFRVLVSAFDFLLLCSQLIWGKFLIGRVGL